MLFADEPAVDEAFDFIFTFDSAILPSEALSTSGALNLQSIEGRIGDLSFTAQNLSFDGASLAGVSPNGNSGFSFSTQLLTAFENAEQA